MMGVNGNPHPWSELPDDGPDSPPFLFYTGALRTGPRGITPDLDYIGPLIDQRQPLRDGAFGREIFSPVGETVGRDIQNTDDRATSSERFSHSSVAALVQRLLYHRLQNLGRGPRNLLAIHEDARCSL